MKLHIKQTLISNLLTDRIKEIKSILLSNRHLDTAESQDRFFNPSDPLTIDASEFGIDKLKLSSVVSRLRRAISDHQPILIYGDYDADGVSSTAILWETLHNLGADAVPFIPSRHKHGYGLSIKGLEDAFKILPMELQSKENTQSLPLNPKPLVLTVDNGIVAFEAADYLSKQGIELIITDHHSPGSSKPVASHILHSTTICGSGVAWVLSRELSHQSAVNTLDLVAIGTIADIMPVVGVNRSLIKFGLNSLSHTKRPGLKALYLESGLKIDQGITTYQVNFVIAPRINAMGRLEEAIDALRLLLTTNPDRANKLASTLGSINRDRQDLTKDLVDHAVSLIGPNPTEHIIVAANEQYHEGVVGLIAGKLTEKFHRPSIVLSIKDNLIKGSARSINGVNIIDMIRTQQEYLLGCGGHPMAAGLSLTHESLASFTLAIQNYAKKNIPANLLIPQIEVETQLETTDCTTDLMEVISLFAPFGVGNREPLFSISGTISNLKLLKDGQQAKFNLIDDKTSIDCIWFNHQHENLLTLSNRLVTVVGQLSINNFNGNKNMQVIVKQALT